MGSVQTHSRSCVSLCWCTCWHLLVRCGFFVCQCHMSLSINWILQLRYFPNCSTSMLTGTTKAETSRQLSLSGCSGFCGLLKPSRDFLNSRCDVNICKHFSVFSFLFHVKCLTVCYFFSIPLVFPLYRLCLTVWSHLWRTSSTSSLCTSSSCSSLLSLQCSSLRGSSSIALTAPWIQRKNASKWIYCMWTITVRV